VRRSGDDDCDDDDSDKLDDVAMSLFKTLTFDEFKKKRNLFFKPTSCNVESWAVFWLYLPKKIKKRCYIVALNCSHSQLLP
jgi:hypothetical protein